MFRLREPGSVAEAWWQAVQVAPLSSAGAPARRTRGVVVNASRTTGMPAASDSRIFERINPSYARRCCLATNVDKKILVGFDAAELDGESRVARRYIGYPDVELVEPYEAWRQTLIRDISLCLSEKECGVGVEIRRLGGDIPRSG